jgi:hypothetical protein
MVNTYQKVPEAEHALVLSGNRLEYWTTYTIRFHMLLVNNSAIEMTLIVHPCMI